VDLALYGRVLWRFRTLVVGGSALAIALSVLSVAKITSHGLVYRSPEVWQSTSTVLLTQHGFPWGRATLPGSEVGAGSQYADPTRFSSLTDLYSQFANSDQVKQILRRDGAKKSWKLLAKPVEPTNPASALPVILLTGQANSPAEAVSATVLGRKAFLEYVAEEQAGAAIPENQRIDIQTIQSATKPTIFTPRKKTLPIVILLAVLSATFALAFVFENLRPLEAPVPLPQSQPQPQPQPTEQKQPVVRRPARSRSGA
jgi:hypothetical protein